MFKIIKIDVIKELEEIESKSRRLEIKIIIEKMKESLGKCLKK